MEPPPPVPWAPLAWGHLEQHEGVLLTHHQQPRCVVAGRQQQMVWGSRGRPAVTSACPVQHATQQAAMGVQAEPLGDGAPHSLTASTTEAVPGPIEAGDGLAGGSDTGAMSAPDSDSHPLEDDQRHLLHLPAHNINGTDGHQRLFFLVSFSPPSSSYPHARFVPATKCSRHSSGLQEALR